MEEEKLENLTEVFEGIKKIVAYWFFNNATPEQRDTIIVLGFGELVRSLSEEDVEKLVESQLNGS